MACKGDVNMVLTVTSTKIKFTTNSKRKCVGSLSCREELVGAGAKRSQESLRNISPIPSKISRRVLIFPISSDCNERIPWKTLSRRNKDKKTPSQVQQQQQYHHQQQQQHFLQQQQTDQIQRVPFFPPHQLQCYPQESVYSDSQYEYNSTPVPYPPCHGLVPSPPSLSPPVKGGRQVNPIPRHRRSSHINAEHRRRSKIQKGFDALKDMIPALAEGSNISSKDSKSEMLHKTAGHVREMSSEMKKQKKEIDALKQEIADLNVEIESFQQRLPATGITTVDKPSCHIEAMYRRFVRERTQEDWKFWLFSFIMRPLFESYNKMVTTSSVPSFIQSVREWAHENLSLVNLRPCILSALRKISLQSSILSNPKKLKEEALEIVSETSDKQ